MAAVPVPAPARAGLARLVLGLLGLAALGALALTVMAEEAEATHFRGGTLYATPKPELGDYAVRFEGRLFFRIDHAYFWATPSACSVGTVFSSFATVNSIATGSASVPFRVKVTACNVAEDWFAAKVIDPSGADGVLHVYPSAADPSGQPWVAAWESASRLDDNSPNYHVNNPDVGWRLETTVDLQGVPDEPPRPFVPPIVQCPTAGACVIPVPFVDNDLLAGPAATYTFRFSEPEEAVCQTTAMLPAVCPGSVFLQPGDPACPVAQCGTAAPAIVPPALGEVQWDTTGAVVSTVPGDITLYSVQVMVEDGREKVPMDWLIRLVDGAPPHWVMPPTPCGQTIEVTKGDPVSFPVQAASPIAAKTVTMFPIEAPTGAVFTGGLAGNPSTGSFSWGTATAALGYHIAVFFAIDNEGLTAPSCVVVIRVLGPPPPPPPPPPGPVLPLSVAFEHDPSPGCDRPWTQFWDRSSGSLVGWHWDFGDGHSSDVRHPVHEYAHGGTYDVVLTVWDVAGNVGSVGGHLTFSGAVECTGAAMPALPLADLVAAEMPVDAPVEDPPADEPVAPIEPPASPPGPPAEAPPAPAPVVPPADASPAPPAEPAACAACAVAPADEPAAPAAAPPVREGHDGAGCLAKLVAGSIIAGLVAACLVVGWRRRRVLWG